MKKVMKQKTGKGAGLQRIMRGIALLLLLPLLAVGCGKDEEEEPYRFRCSMDGVVLIEESAQKDGICMVYEESTYIDAEYYQKKQPYLLLDRYAVEKDAELSYNKHQNLELFKLVYTVHDLQSGASYTITQEELESVLPEDLKCLWGTAYSHGEGFAEYQGKWYLYVGTESRNFPRNWEDAEDSFALVDLESGEIETVQSEAIEEIWYSFASDREYWKSMEIFRWTSLMSTNGFWEYEVSPDDAPYLEIEYLLYAVRPESDVVQVEAESAGLPERNKALYAKFPGLEQYKGKEGYRAEIYLTGKPGAEEVFRLFIEDGQEISFEGVTVPAKYAVDGQEHKVDSFEDWNRCFLLESVTGEQ